MQLFQNGTPNSLTFPAKQPLVGPPGYANSGPPGTVDPTKFDPDIFNTVLLEFWNLSVAAGIPFDPADDGQLLKWLNKLYPIGVASTGASFSASGTLAATDTGKYFTVGNGLTINLPVPTSALRGVNYGFAFGSGDTIATLGGTFVGGALNTLTSYSPPANSFLVVVCNSVNWSVVSASPDIMGFSGATSAGNTIQKQASGVVTIVHRTAITTTGAGTANFPLTLPTPFPSAMNTASVVYAGDPSTGSFPPLNTAISAWPLNNNQVNIGVNTTSSTPQTLGLEVTMTGE